MILFKFLSIVATVYFIGCLIFVIIWMRETLKNGLKNFKFWDQLGLIVFWPINITLMTKFDQLFFINGKENKK